MITLLALMTCPQAHELIANINSHDDMPAMVREDLRREVRTVTPHCFDIDGNVRRD